MSAAWTEPSVPRHSAGNTLDSAFETSVNYTILGGRRAEPVSPRKHRCGACQRTTRHGPAWCEYTRDVRARDLVEEAWLSGHEQGAPWATATVVSRVVLDKGCAEGHKHHGSRVVEIPEDAKWGAVPSVAAVLNRMAPDTDEDGEPLPVGETRAARSARAAAVLGGYIEWAESKTREWRWLWTAKRVDAVAEFIRIEEHGWCEVLGEAVCDACRTVADGQDHLQTGPDVGEEVPER